MKRFPGLALVAMGVAMASAPAFAQSLTGSGKIINPAEGSRPAPAARQAPPPALPGARPRADTPVAPKSPDAADLSPTDSLFDAINRGDMASARDAVNRGADINGRNVLGMTPIDLAVDLGRNDITFLLLSLRAAAPVDQDEQTAAAKPTKNSRTAAAKPAPAPRPARTQGLAVTRVAPPTPASPPRQFAGDGGAPLPQAGFLGFGETRQP